MRESLLSCWTEALPHPQEATAAIFLGNPTIRGWLLDKQSPGGETPLHCAAQFGHKKMVRTLLAAGANPMLKDCDGWTPDKSAKKAGHVALADEIISTAFRLL